MYISVILKIGKMEYGKIFRKGLVCVNYLPSYSFYAMVLYFMHTIQNINRKNNK